MQQQSFVAQMAGHPGTFAFGVGIANGVLAAVRNKPISPNAAYITAGVIAAGELALVAELPPDQKPDMVRLGVWSLVGTLAGLALFTEWQPGQPSLVQRAGERLADIASERALGPAT
jgi:hypothetical protein